MDALVEQLLYTAFEAGTLRSNPIDPPTAAEVKELWKKYKEFMLEKLPEMSNVRVYKV